MGTRHRATLALTLTVVFVAAACTSDPAPEPATTVATTLASATTTAASETAATVSEDPAPSADEVAASKAALDTKDEFFVSFNAADAVAVMNLFTADAEFTDKFGQSDRQWFEELLAWNVAQGTRYTPSDCTTETQSESSEVTVACEYITHDAPSIASGGPPVPFTIRLVVTPQGITSYSDAFGSPDFNTVGDPFSAWMNQYHPDEAALVDFGEWQSVDGATENGTLRGQYAAEWGAHLVANGCEYNEGC